MLQGSEGSSCFLSWYSKKQSMVSLSTAEAEIVAAVTSIRKFDELIDACKILGLGTQFRLMIDNEAALTAMSRGYSEKLNYVNKTRNVYIRWVPSYCSCVGMRLMRIHTSLNVADMFTKLLPRQRKQELMNIANLRNHSELC